MGIFSNYKESGKPTPGCIKTYQKSIIGKIRARSSAAYVARIVRPVYDNFEDTPDANWTKTSTLLYVHIQALDVDGKTGNGSINRGSIVVKRCEVVPLYDVVVSVTPTRMLMAP